MSSGNDESQRALITRRAALLGLAAGSALLSAPDQARAEDDWDKIVAAAKKEGHVVIYSAFVGLAAHQDLKKDFEANLRHHGRYPGSARERDPRAASAIEHSPAATPPTFRKTAGPRQRCRSRRITFSIHSDRCRRSAT